MTNQRVQEKPNYSSALGLSDTTLSKLLAGLHAKAATQDPEILERAIRVAGERGATTEADVADILADAFIPIDPLNGQLLHLLAAGRRDGRIVEFGTSMGLSTMYLAAALRDDEEPIITTEIEPSKIRAALANFEAAGLTARIELRGGDAHTSLVDFDEPISLLYLDGFKSMYLSVLRLLEPQLCDRALVVADDTTHLAGFCQDFLDYVRAEDSDFTCVELPIDGGIQLCVYNRNPV